MKSFRSTALSMTSLFAAVLVVSAFASSSQAAEVKLRKVSNLTAPQEMPTQVMIDAVKKAVENQCHAMSASDTLEIVSEKITDSFSYGGQEVVTGKAGCEDLDLPCSRVPSKIVNAYQLRSLELTLLRKHNGQRYTIKASTSWSLDLPVPLPDVRLASRYCR